MVVETLCGKVEGVQKGGLYQFLGIPYAKAERFCMPEPVCWDGVLKADHFGKKAVQTWRQKGGEYDEQIRSGYGEDCQNLNIYVPADVLDGNGEPLPVAVYIHGGGFQNGSNQGRDGEMMIRDHRFLYVSINYRLGVLGYLYLGKKLGEQWQHTGNNGTLDQLAALKWIYENIEKFGGDKSRITVFGESAGAKTMGALLLRPEMKTYCSQVLMASGSSQCIRSTVTASEIAGAFFAEMKTCCPDCAEEDVFTMDVDKLLEIQEHIVDNPGNTCMFGPVADDIVIPLNWKEQISSGNYWSGKAMIGSCLNESIFYKINDADFVKKAPDIVKALFGRNSEIAIAEFEEANAEQKLSQDEKADLWVKILSDYMYRTYTRRLADQLLGSGSKVWYYSFEFGAASHCQDQGMAFHKDFENDAYYAGINMDDRRKMADIIYESYANFFEKGDPNWKGIPEWKSLDERRDVMIWKQPVEIVELEDTHTLTRFPDEVFVLG